MEIHSGPEVVTRDAVHYLGIREVTPFRGMISRSDHVMARLKVWCRERGLSANGAPFIRLHVIDMKGLMDYSVGIPVSRTDRDAADGKVLSDTLPAGRYATMTYNNHAIRANGHLITWCAENGLAFDRHDVPGGDAFACRYEAFLTDPVKQPRKTLQHIQLNIKLSDEGGRSAVR